MSNEKGIIAEEVFDSIAFGNNPFYEQKGWFSGRVTTDNNFTFYEKSDLNLNIIFFLKLI